MSAMNAMTSTARLVVVGGVMAYRALFNWTTPSMFVGTLLASPIFQLFFFVYVGRSLGVADDNFYIVGNAVLAASVSGVFGGTMAIANERRYGTLSNVLLSPRSRAAIFLGRGLPYVLNGMLISVVVFVCAAVFLGWRVSPGVPPMLLLVLLVGSLSCTAFGLVVGSLGLWLRDVFVIPNFTAALLLVVTGVNVPASRLPDGVRLVGEWMPLTHAVAAARGVAGGAGISDVLPELFTELAIAVGYTLLALALMGLLEIGGRRWATVE